MFNTERAIQNMRNMVGSYALNKAHLKIDNFCRVYYGTYSKNLHGLEEPYYILAGTILPDLNTGRLTLIRDLTVKDEIWDEVKETIDDMLAVKEVA
ncbi:hypothetical protein pEaSNUABM37_00234 [Erwinia phage pEa_SNUABM_37]|nr:hypothetical protein pEaSNUABM37_00234 [Erwinia phage pEa_SNUABM_37]QXO10702.1 hypothetical protein pEaSNUABM48_00234 [Erwinia phage pEa_SNUABM_48]